jgi:cytochrome c
MAAIPGNARCSMPGTLRMAAALTVAFSATAFAQDIQKGETAFNNKCLTCHAIGVSAGNKIGPPLNGLDGTKAAAAANFNYSAAMKKSEIVWNEVTFREFIADPKAKIPGTKMLVTGIKSDQEISDLWAYVKQFNADGNVKK